MNDTLGYIHWFLTFVAFNCTFFPYAHFGREGVAHAPLGDRHRVPVPATHAGHQRVHQHLGLLKLGASQLIFLFNYFYSIVKGPKAGDNPWNAITLEWTIPSPAPYHNFDKIPTVYRGPYEYSSPECDKKGTDLDCPRRQAKLHF